MEKKQKIQIGLVALVALLLIANLFGGGFKNWFSSEGDQIRSAASTMEINGQTVNKITADPSQNPDGSGNIPGMNQNATPAPTGPTTTIQYEQDKFDFGVADEGEVVKHIFKFKNVGSEPLLITNCKGSCGCTVPTWPKEPIPPGGSGEIKVEFNTKGKPGRQSKRVTVTANTVPTETFIEVAGEVRGKEMPVGKGNVTNNDGHGH